MGVKKSSRCFDNHHWLGGKNSQLLGIYTSLPVVSATATLDQLSTCLADVEAWLKASRPCLNPGKTQVMWLSSQQLLSRLDIADVSILLSLIPVQETARDLGVVIDSRLTLSDHVAAVCRSGYYQLRQLRPAVWQGC